MGAFRTAGLALFGLFAVILLSVAAVYVLSELRLDERVRVPSGQGQVAVPNDIAAIQHGQHLVGAIALCTPSATESIPPVGACG